MALEAQMPGFMGVDTQVQYNGLLMSANSRSLMISGINQMSRRQRKNHEKQSSLMIWSLIDQRSLSKTRSRTKILATVQPWEKDQRNTR